ncbi:MAG: glycosyltransferase [Methanobacteriota archaeon]
MPPHVLHLVPHLRRGGLEPRLAAELGGLAGHFRFTLAHGSAGGADGGGRLDGAAVPRTWIRNLRHYDAARMPLAIAEFRRHLEETRPDILHVHSTEAAAVGRLAARRFGIPVVYSLHGVPFGAGRSWPLRRFVVEVERRLAPDTARYVAGSRSLSRIYLSTEIGRPEQFVTIPEGFDVRAAADAPAVELPGERPRILFAGRLERGRGVRRLHAAVAELRRRGVSASLVVAGEGALAPWLAERGDPWLHVLQHRNGIAGVAKSADVLAVPSETEPSPRLLVEAMACGIPIVATGVGGVPEHLGEDDAGILVPKGDDAALVAALERLLSDPDLSRDLGATGRKRAERFSAEAMLSATAALYRELL